MSNCNDQRQNLNLKLKNICKPYPCPNYETKITELNGSDAPKVNVYGPRDSVKEAAARKAVLAAAEEWDEVTCIVPQLQAQNDSSENASKGIPCTPLVSFEEAFSAFRASDLSEQMSHIQPYTEKRGLAAVLGALFGPSKLNPCLEPERNVIFAIALCQMDWGTPLHGQILQTIYKRLTGTRLNCPKYGGHWQDIGFQGSDPSTDVRGVGMLGILQFLHLASAKPLEPLARDIYRVARSETQNFPLAVMSINLTKVALDALRRGQLNRECNSRGSVITVLNDFYSAVFCHTFLIWTQQHKTIVDAGHILKGPLSLAVYILPFSDAEKYCSRHVAKALRNLQVHLSSYAERNGCRSDAVAPAEPQQKRLKRCTDNCDPATAGDFDNVLSTEAS